MVQSPFNYTDYNISLIFWSIPDLSFVLSSQQEKNLSGVYAGGLF